MTVYKVLGLDFETPIANLPSFPSGNPLWILNQFSPPSVDLYKALFSPPELNDQAVLLNSHIEAYKVFGLEGSIAKSAHPVELFRNKIFSQVSPPSVDLKTPLSSLSDQSAPKTATYISLEFSGLTIMFAILSEFSSPIFFQLLPPSVDLYKPSPIETLFLGHGSPVPTYMVLSGSLGSNSSAPIDWAWSSKIG